MQLTINYFGRLQEVLACTASSITLAEGTTVALLVDQLTKAHPALAGQAFQVAVNRQLALPEQLLQAGDEVALLPPFSGG